MLLEVPIEQRMTLQFLTFQVRSIKIVSLGMKIEGRTFVVSGGYVSVPKLFHYHYIENRNSTEHPVSAELRYETSSKQAAMCPSWI